MTMRTAEEIAALEAAAASWVGTPWCPNSAKKGAGACCHKLCGAVLFEAGWLPAFDIPDGPPQLGRAGSDPLIERYLDKSPLFVDADPNRRCAEFGAAALELVLPGDLVVSRPARLPHHLSLALTGGRFLHVQWGGLVGIAPNLPDAWRKRLSRIFRPLP